MTIEMKKQFDEYHAANPEIYEAFKKLALQAVRRKGNWSARGIFHKLRWDYLMGDADWTKKKGFKLLNATSPYYVRLFEKEYPQYKGFFRKKKILPEDFSDPTHPEVW